MRKAGKCVHYNGMINACCAAGVNYKELAGPGDAYMSRLPCHTPEYRWGGDRPPPVAGVVAVCDKRQEPTAEEVAKDKQWLIDRMDRMGKVRAAIVAACGGPWKKGGHGMDGTINCPCCDGRVKFIRSGHNGHIHASCSTPDCVSWME